MQISLLVIELSFILICVRRRGGGRLVTCPDLRSHRIPQTHTPNHFKHRTPIHAEHRAFALSHCEWRPITKCLVLSRATHFAPFAEKIGWTNENRSWGGGECSQLLRSKNVPNTGRTKSEIGRVHYHHHRHRTTDHYAKLDEELSATRFPGCAHTFLLYLFGQTPPPPCARFLDEHASVQDH